jgi:apolipoprotein N-acyltransferase
VSPLAGRGALRGFFSCLIATAASVLLFAGAHPNPFFPGGLPFLAWIAYAPVFWLLHRVKAGASVFWGALYGYASYRLFNYWLSDFHPLAGLFVHLLYLGYFALLFPLLKGAIILFPRRGYILQWLLWMGFEYLRTLGFLGYSYGITGYSQWRLIPLIQIAGIFGVWGVSALVLFPQTLIAALFRGERPRFKGLGGRLRGEMIPALIWAAALGGALIYGAASPAADSGEKVRIALIQHNSDPWRGGIPAYRQNFEVLKRLSDEALRTGPQPDLVVWSETAFVPRIYWHSTYRDDPESWDLVKKLLDYLAVQEVPFVIGNDDARRELSPEGRWERVDYNAVILFDRGEMSGLYRKLHLVPMTEHFPYRKQLPWIYEALEKADTHFWKKGTEAAVFDSRGIKFSSPICFEDSFGYLSRNFVRNGAELIVNLSNDAWSNSLPAQMQHLSMAVFRAVENRRAMVRSTASGQTCGIDPSGRVIAMAEPFTEAALTVEVPLVREETLYTRYGDWLPLFFIILAGLMLIGGIISYIIRKYKIGRTG